MTSLAEAPHSASFVYPTKNERFSSLPCDGSVMQILKKLGIPCSRDPPPHPVTHSSNRSETIGGPKGKMDNRNTQRTHTLSELTPTISSLNADWTSVDINISVSMPLKSFWFQRHLSPDLNQVECTSVTKTFGGIRLVLITNISMLTRFRPPCHYRQARRRQPTAPCCYHLQDALDSEGAKRSRRNL